MSLNRTLPDWTRARARPTAPLRLRLSARASRNSSEALVTQAYQQDEAEDAALGSRRGDELPAEASEASTLSHRDWSPRPGSRRRARKKARIRSGSFLPGAASTPRPPSTSAMPTASKSSANVCYESRTSLTPNVLFARRQSHRRCPDQHGSTNLWRSRQHSNYRADRSHQG